MHVFEFKTYLLGDSVDFTKITGAIRESNDFDEPIVYNRSIPGITAQNASNIMRASLYPTGIAILMNVSDNDSRKFFEHLKSSGCVSALTEDVKNLMTYVLKVDERFDREKAFKEYSELSEHTEHHFEIIESILAKIVLSRSLNMDISDGLIRIKKIVENMKNGDSRLGLNDMTKVVGTVSDYEYRSLLLRSKPKGLGNNKRAIDYYSQMLSIFDIENRLDEIEYKVDKISNMIEWFFSANESKRNTILELSIIILLMVEVFSLFFDYFFG